MSRPADFLIGVLDFFAVLLPGAIVTWLLSLYLPPDLRAALRIESGEHANSVPWFVFLFTSYALGHFVFMAGSKLDPAYDRWRARKQPLESDSGYKAARALRKKLTPELESEVFTTFKWARTYVALHSPSARDEIDRLEASSKFFRGMVIVALPLAAHFLLARHDLLLATASLVLCALSFARFCDQRWKMTELTFATSVIVAATKPKEDGGAGKAGAGGEGSD